MTYVCRSVNRLLRAWFVLAFGISAPAQALIPVTPDCDQTSQPLGSGSPPLPENILPNPGGVDMRSGQYLYSHTDLEAPGGLKLERMFTPQLKEDVIYYGPFGYLTHNWDISVDEDRIAVCTSWEIWKRDYSISVVVGSRTQSFYDDYALLPGEHLGRVSGGPHSSLTFEGHESSNGVWVPDRYIFEDSEGTKFLFRNMSGVTGSRSAKIGKIEKVDGSTFDFIYGSNGLDTVVSNRGYALHFEYSAEGVSAYGSGLPVVKKACIVDLAVQLAPAANSACPAGVPTADYEYTSGKVSAFTDQGRVRTLLGPHASLIYRPGETTPYLTNQLVAQYLTYVVTKQTFADGRVINYQWTPSSNFKKQAIGGTYTTSQGTVSVKYKEFQEWTGQANMYLPSVGPIEVKDELGRTKTYVYSCHACVPSSAKDPAGQARVYQYGPYDQVTQIQHIPVAGSGQTTIIENKQYGCTIGACYQKPTKIIDALARETDFTYDIANGHGGVLTETAPPDANGVRAQKRYSYAQRYAWISDGSGGFVPASTPVWVLASEEFCRTSSADASGNCAAGAADEVVTTYDYGPDSGPNHLLLRGTAVTSNGTTLRSCISYDALGRKISETKPMANLSVCP